MEAAEEASSDNSTVIPRSSTQADTTAPRSNVTDLFGLGAARRDTTRLVNSDTFSIGGNRIPTHGKGKRKDLGHQGRRPRSRLSSASSASLGSIPVEVPEHPWQKDFHEGLSAINKRHSEMLDQQASSYSMTNRLSKDMDSINGNVRQLLVSQRSTEERLSAYDTLQKTCTARVERVERYLQQVDSNLSDLRKETQVQSRDMGTQQLDISLSLKALTAEVQAIRANQVKAEAKQRGNSPPATYLPRKETPKYQPPMTKPKVDLDYSGPCMSMQPSGPSSQPPRMKTSTRNVALDPRTLSSSASNSDDDRNQPSRRDESTAYYTAHTHADISEFPRARRTIEKAKPPSPQFTSTRKRQRRVTEARTMTQDSDPHTISTIPP